MSVKMKFQYIPFQLLILSTVSIILVTSQCSSPPVNTLIKVTDYSAEFELTGCDTVQSEKASSFIARYRMLKTDGTLTPMKEGLQVSLMSYADSAGNFTAKVKASGLNSGQIYYFSFVVLNKQGKASQASNEVEAKILPSVPNVSWNRVSEDKLSLTWTQSDKGNETSYTIGVAQNDKPNCGYSITLQACYGNSYTLTGLMEGIVYRFEVFAESPNGRSRSAIIFYPE
ncbi:uncharacterized protein LOC141850890 [Brevipalpus obovatus]|uniref:uncharacterized protein LOC141850890 n=1 Tax=Brevipalpus obovatus TaxID=246614 RepID=UPI003D9F0D65